MTISSSLRIFARTTLSGLALYFITACASVYYDRDPYNSIFLTQNLNANTIHFSFFRVAVLVSSDVVMKENSQSMKVTVFNMKNNKGAPYAYEETFTLQLTPGDRERGLRVDRVRSNQKLYVFKVADIDEGKANNLMNKLRAIPEGDQKAAFAVTPRLVKCATPASNENKNTDIYFSFTGGIEYSGTHRSTDTSSVIRSEACAK